MKGNIDYIIATVLNGTATDDEKNILNEWIREDKLNSEVYESILNFWKINNRELEIINEDDVRNKIWIKAHESRHTKSRNLLPIIYRVAAVLVIVFTFTFLINAFLTAPKRDADIVVLKTIEKKNLAGVKSTIHLPDGSKVNLNAESSIKFIEGFKDSIRWIELDGEAVFHVVKNIDKPFIVKSGDILTKALGTVFNINAYEDNSITVVSLVEGKVEIHPVFEENSDESTFLEPGQYASFQNHQVIEKGIFDYTKVIGWKDGIIYFENADYNTVVRKLERWYGVTFEDKELEPKWNLDAKFENASLEQILEVLSHSEQFEYKLIDDTVKIN